MAPATNRVTRRRRGGGGFTLVEMIAVLAVVVVLAAVAVPVLSGATDNRAAMAGRVLLRDLTYARQRAVATGTPAWVVFDLAGQRWSLMAEDPDNPGRAGAAVLTDPATGRSFNQQLNAGEFVGVRLIAVDFDGHGEIGFNWLGQPFNSEESPLDGDGSVTLSGGIRLTVSVSTGHVAYATP